MKIYKRFQLKEMLVNIYKVYNKMMIMSNKTTIYNKIALFKIIINNKFNKINLKLIFNFLCLQDLQQLKVTQSENKTYHIFKKVLKS